VIIRRDAHQLLLITQPDHAGVAAAIAAAWQRDGLRQSPSRDAILFATREHDNGWREVDQSPIVDPGSGQLLDFVHAPDQVRQDVWPRGADRINATPYAAALVAHHALSIYDRDRERPGWSQFFAMMEQMRDDAIERAAPASIDDVRRDYFFLRISDLASLAFCAGWIEPQHLAGYQLQLEGSRLRIAPDPFAGIKIPLRVVARRIPARRYESDLDAAAAFRDAPRVDIDGTALGA
jgi:hypothetical protein